ncbi:toxin-antitoxin system antitoxin subunit [Flavonifractor sp. An4]|uniref:toxin-antitoxin system antitoxin subunit n=1 Tax=Flavonifractor sp. An4 TaxID=1965634 RepID=UPI000B3AD09C|nr:toxin-antitoxin system antitoxin subunit [Flavonifractor sp. An4]OUO10752.1 toxin-antitoxin system antitoxin subunit [Flavonifractor sp. An4]
MKKRAIFGVVLAAAGAAGWYLTANRRKNQMEIIREQVRKLLAVRRDELQLLRKAAQAGELPSEGFSTQPLDGLEVEAVRLEDGALTVCLCNGAARAWLSDQPLDRLNVHQQPWRGSARPGVLYTENLGDGWHVGYACLHWS